MKSREIRDSNGQLLAEVDPTYNSVRIVSEPAYDVLLAPRDWVVLSPGTGTRITIIRINATEFKIIYEHVHINLNARIGGSP